MRVKTVKILLLFLILLLQPSLWFGEHGIVQLYSFNKKLSYQGAELEKIIQRNQELAKQLQYIKTNNSAVEEHARSKLGMIKRGETYYRVVTPVE